MPSTISTMTRSRLRVLVLLAAIPIAALLGGLIEAARASSVASAPQAQRIDLAAGYPSFARGYRLSLTKAILPPGAAFPPHRHPGMQVAYVESGTLQYTVFRGKVRIFKGQPGKTQKLVRVLRAGQTGSIKTGQWLIETPTLHHQGTNVGHRRVVILLAALLRSDEPPAIPVTP